MQTDATIKSKRRRNDADHFQLVMDLAIS